MLCKYSRMSNGRQHPLSPVNVCRLALMLDNNSTGRASARVSFLSAPSSMVVRQRRDERVCMREGGGECSIASCPLCLTHWVMVVYEPGWRMAGPAELTPLTDLRPVRGQPPEHSAPRGLTNLAFLSLTRSLSRWLVQLLLVANHYHCGLAETEPLKWSCCLHLDANASSSMDAFVWLLETILLST